MSARWATGRSLRTLLAPLLLAGALIGAAPGGASGLTGKSCTVVPSPNVGTTGNYLRAVAATSATSALAVGYYSNNGGATYHTLTEQWNGSAWTVVPSPNPGGSSANDLLWGVAATSPGNAWAVGSYAESNGVEHALIQCR